MKDGEKQTSEKIRINENKSQPDRGSSKGSGDVGGSSRQRNGNAGGGTNNVGPRKK